MERIDPHPIASALLASAGWARVGLTAPSDWLREQAAKELAQTIADALNQGPEPDPRQLGLFG